MRGAVTTFDEAKGYGTVTDTSGDTWFFHCTAITGGSRTIEVGATVAFEVVPGGLGRYEAARLTPV